MKIIHISDLHYPDTGDNSKRLVDKIIEHYESSTDKPKVVLTGDLVHTSINKNHFRYAKNNLNRLIENDFSLFLCPGNHDLKPDGVGVIFRGRKRFNRYFKGLLPKGINYFGEEDNNFLDFPLVHQTDNHFFIGLDSLETEHEIGATGQLGRNQISELIQTVAEIREKHTSPVIIVYLHHHPLKFSYRPKLLRLKDKKEFLDAVKGINVLLFGHLHHNKRFESDEKKYNINLINLAGGSTYGSNVDWTEIDTQSFASQIISY